MWRVRVERDRHFHGFMGELPIEPGVLEGAYVDKYRLDDDANYKWKVRHPNGPNADNPHKSNERDFD